jgi:hypothetical protein
MITEVFHSFLTVYWLILLSVMSQQLESLRVAHHKVILRLFEVYLSKSKQSLSKLSQYTKLILE